MRHLARFAVVSLMLTPAAAVDIEWARASGEITIAGKTTRLSRARARTNAAASEFLVLITYPCSNPVGEFDPL